MSKFKIGLPVALVTFIVGVVAVSLCVIHSRHVPKASPPIPKVAVRQRPHHPDGWKRIVVDGKFSFYLPPDMEQEKESVGNIEYIGPGKSFVSNTLSVGYTYVEKKYNKELWRGKVSCELLTREPPHVSNIRSSEVEINGRRARQIFWQAEKSKLSVVRVCFPDVGDGTVLTLGAVSKDDEVLDVAKQILDSIEFP
jgi:hypothetical protein